LNCLAASGVAWAAMNCRPSLPDFVSAFARLRVCVQTRLLGVGRDRGYLIDLEDLRGSFAHGVVPLCLSAWLHAPCGVFVFAGKRVC
jgi:hypothetical protein